VSHNAENHGGGAAALCENGITPSGWHCTGSAHVGSILIRCTDPSHNVASALVTTAPRPTFDELLNDPTQQLDTEGVVLASILDEQERDRLRSEGWRACVEHLRQRYNRQAEYRPAVVPYILLDGEDLWFLDNRHNPYRPRRVIPPAATGEEAGR